MISDRSEQIKVTPLPTAITCSNIFLVPGTVLTNSFTGAFLSNRVASMFVMLVKLKRNLLELARYFEIKIISLEN